MTLRSPSRGEYWRRMAYVVLLTLAAYAIVISEQGGGGTFQVWRPERMRFVLIALIVVGAAAHELRPRGAVPPDVKPSGKPDARRPDEPEPEKQPAELSVSEVSVPTRSPQPAPASAPAVVTSAERVAVHVPKTPPEDSSDDAEAIWARAREMQHEFVPDEVSDGEYLRLVRKAAGLGHVLARAKLGDYAFRRGWIVEAYYWTLLARLNGSCDLDVALDEIRKVWVREGFPPEYENVRPDFSESQGVFARAVLRLKCGRDVTLARKRLQELADAKCHEAELYLARTVG